MSITRDYLDRHHDRMLDELFEFLRIPSVSTDPAYASDLRRAADFLGGQLAAAEMEHVEVLQVEGSHPALYADWLHAPGAPTILVYGHYDVQPPDPVDAWTSPPFEPTLRDGRIYCRGVSDDKAPMFIPVKVAEAFLKSEGRLPVNLRFLLEGEEEVGSRNLGRIAEANKAKLAADFILSADGAMWRPDLPSVNVACRGNVVCEVKLTTAAKDLHSGRYGGTVANPLHLMARLVAGLHDAEGMVAIEGFYDEVRELPPEERAAIAAIPFDEDAYRTRIGATALLGETGYSTLERNWTRPTLDLNGMWGGYQGPGSKTVIAHEAFAKISCRLVPDQDPARIGRTLKQHLETHCPPGGRLEFVWRDSGSAAYEVPADHPGLRIAEAVLTEIDGVKPVRVRIGGTLPISGMFRQVLGLETIQFSFSIADEDFHAPNEFFRLPSFRRGLHAWARYWELPGMES
jgi:acetylornithine deacetylase/succinyl-diaminopimelate desuccinylase-like protein